jgi:hypothetical protein
MKPAEPLGHQTGQTQCESHERPEQNPKIAIVALAVVFYLRTQLGEAGMHLTAQIPGVSSKTQRFRYFVGSRARTSASRVARR